MTKNGSFQQKMWFFSAKNSPNQIYLTETRRFIKISSQKANRVNDHPEIQNNVLKRRRVIEFDSLQTHEKKPQYDFYGKKNREKSLKFDLALSMAVNYLISMPFATPHNSYFTVKYFDVFLRNKSAIKY